jgi:GNAT superfamily N-acetyltransferase
VIETRTLTEAEFDATDAVLPLHRFDGWSDDSTYLVAWDGPHPVGHVHIAWAGTELRLPELQDMYVLPERRGAGIGAALAATAERLVAERGHSRCSLSVSARNDRARSLYERLGYTAADQPPKHVRGTITIRGKPVEVDDVLVYLTKPVVDLAAGRSS